MKHSGLMFSSLALCCSVANAASDSTFSGNTLHIPHVVYAGAMYDVTMTFQAPDKLILATATPVTTSDSPAVMVSEALKFKLTGISAGGLSYRADINVVEGSTSEFKATGIRAADFGIMLKGEQITNLGILMDGGFSYSYSISDDGQSIAGRTRDSKRNELPLRYDFENGEINAVPLTGFKSALARAINNDNTLAGYAELPVEEGEPDITHAFYNEIGKEIQDIGTLGEGMKSRAYGINNTGVVVGWSASKADNTDHIAFSYDIATQTLAPLAGDILGGERSFAFAVNDSNQIAGVATTANGSALAFVHKEGTTTNLGSLDDSGYSEARAINDKGHTTGWSLTADGAYAAFIHDGTTMTKIPGLGGDTKAYGINTNDYVVGDARDADGGRHAFLYKDGEMIDLYDMLPAADKANWKELREAFSISDTGVVVGRGRFWTDKENGKNSSRAFRIQL